MSDTLAAWRRELRERRRALPASIHEERSQAACRHIAASIVFRNSRRIACYLANDGETDLALLIEIALARGKQVYLPVLDKIIARRLFFAPYLPGQALWPNRFGIPEPLGPAHHLQRSNRLDLILMPLVGFDIAGNRIGMGGGFYDRTLAYLRQRRHRPRPHLMGVAFECQRIAAIPARPWDVPLQSIATERGVQRCGRAAMKVPHHLKEQRP